MMLAARSAAPAADPLGLELRRPGKDCWAAILPNTAPGQGPYKVQYFNLAGLVAHHAYATLQAALAAALANGYTEVEPSTLNRLMHSTAWQSRYSTPASI